MAEADRRSNWDVSNERRAGANGCTRSKWNTFKYDPEKHKDKGTSVSLNLEIKQQGDTSKEEATAVAEEEEARRICLVDK